MLGDSDVQDVDGSDCCGVDGQGDRSNFNEAASSWTCFELSCGGEVGVLGEPTEVPEVEAFDAQCFTSA